MVRRNLQTVSDERVRAATGHGRDHWFALLDHAGARDWPHPRIAAHLAENGVPAWWAQAVTVAYEQERGLRLPGQRPDGTFDANASKTLRTSRARLRHLLADDGAREAWSGVALPLAGLTEDRSVRLDGPGGSRVTLWLDWPEEDRVRVSVQHSKLPSLAELERWRDHWRTALGRLADAAAG